jgi:hypothetical protein
MLTGGKLQTRAVDIGERWLFGFGIALPLIRTSAVDK